MGKRKAPGSSGGGGAAKKRKSDKRSNDHSTENLYTLADEILVLGDGDFTFSRGLVTHRGGGRNLVATSYDSDAKVRAKYSNAADCISAVKTAGAHVLHDVDATKLHLLPLRGDAHRPKLPSFFKFIIFNFPHTGQQRVHLNRTLLREFFTSARDKLVKTGEVHLTLKNRPPYSNWLVEDQAKVAGLVLKERRKFNLRNFPGYNHRTTDPQAKAFEAELCITYVFVVNRSKYPFAPIATAQQEKERLAEQGYGEEPGVEDAQEEDEAPVRPNQREDPIVDEPVTKTNKKPTKRKRTKRHAAHGVLSAVEPTAPPLASVTQIPLVKRTAPFALWRPLHRR